MPLPPPPAEAFIITGIADLLGDLDGVLGVGDLAYIARDGRYLGRRGGLLALDLVAHGGDRLGVGTDEDDPGLGQRDGKRLTLGEEAVARMHSLGPGLLAGIEDLVDHQVGLGRRGRADVDSFVRHGNVNGIAIGIGVDGDGLDAHFARSLDDAAGDLATVGDQNFFEHKPLCPLGRRARIRAASRLRS